MVILMCLTLTIFFGVIAYKGYQLDGNIKLVLGFSSLCVIHLIGLVWLVKSEFKKG